MTQKLSFRMSMLLMLWSGAILLVASIVIVRATHYHFQLYGREALQHQDPLMLNNHLEQAIVQSIVLTVVISLLLAILLSIYVARRFSKPLVQMKQTAMSIAHGNLQAQVPMKNNDEMSELGRALNHLANQLQQQQELRKSMTENIAHELRSPLTTIKSFLSAMKDGIWEPTEERLKSCLDEINRLIHLVSDLEQLNEISSPDFQLHRENLSLKNHLEKTIKRNEPSFMEKSVELRLGFVPSIRMYWDENRMTQVWNNLLSNSLKFSNAGGKVNIEARQLYNELLITVTDSGTGIQEQDLPFIFERFYRADKSRSRQTGGGGLGLAITKSIVEAHGGHIWAENRSSEAGAIVYLKFPLQP